MMAGTHIVDDRSSSGIDRTTIAIKRTPIDAHCFRSASPEIQWEKCDILRDVVAVVDCRSADEDTSVSVAHHLQLLGAVISKNFNKKVTHVIFHDGKQSTYNKAKKFNLRLLSVAWIEACKEAGGRAPEDLYLAHIEECYENPLLKPKNYRCSPAFDWDRVKKGFEFDEKRMRRNRLRREKREYRRWLLDPTYVKPEANELQDPRKTDMVELLGRFPVIPPTMVFYETSSDEDERDEIVPPPLTHRLFKKYPDSPILIEAYQRRERQKAEKAAAAMTGGSADCPSASVAKLSSMLRSYETPKFNKESCDGGAPSSAVITPKRLRDEVFSPSDSETDSKFQALKIVEDATDRPRVRNSIDEFKVVVKRKRKVKRLFSPVSTPTANITRKSTMVLTSFELSERETLLPIIIRLGGFQVKSEVCDETTHVICANQRRTLNVLYGSVRGCWLLSPEWVFKSLEATKWIDEEPYELFEHFPTAQICRLEKVTSPTFKCNIFANVGFINVGICTNISDRDLKKLLVLAGAQIVETVSKANIIVGRRGKNVTCVTVSYLWVLDSIMRNEVLPTDKYLLKQDKRNAS